MAIVNFLLDDKQIEEIDKITDNRSAWVRELVEKELGKEQSLQELELKLEQKRIEYEKLNEKVNNKIQELLEHKEQLRISEIQELERKQHEKQQKEQEIIQKWSILEEIDEIKNFQYTNNWSNLQDLLPLVQKLKDLGHRIGIVQLREYLALRKH